MERDALRMRDSGPFVFAQVCLVLRTVPILLNTFTGYFYLVVMILLESLNLFECLIDLHLCYCYLTR